MSHSNKDMRKSRGGHDGTWIESGHCGQMSNTPGWRRFAKRLSKREKRREAKKIIREAMALAEEEYQEALRFIAMDGIDDYYSHLDDGDWERDWNRATVFTDELTDSYQPYDDGNYDQYEYDRWDWCEPFDYNVTAPPDLTAIPMVDLVAEVNRRKRRKTIDEMIRGEQSWLEGFRK